MPLIFIYHIYVHVEGSDQRFQRLHDVYVNPISEVYLMFYQSVLPVFVNFNKLLQHEEPLIYMLAEEMESFLKKLLGKFVSIAAIKQASSIVRVEYKDKSRQLPGNGNKTYFCLNFQTSYSTQIDSGLHIGLVTRQLLQKLEDEGDISHREVRIFYNAVRDFFVTAVDYAISHLPFQDELIRNAQFLKFDSRETSMFSQVEYFVQR